MKARDEHESRKERDIVSSVIGLKGNGGGAKMTERFGRKMASFWCIYFLYDIQDEFSCWKERKLESEIYNYEEEMKARNSYQRKWKCKFIRLWYNY